MACPPSNGNVTEKPSDWLLFIAGPGLLARTIFVALLKKKVIAPQKWKVVLYDASLVLLPTLVPIYATLYMDISEPCAHIYGFFKKDWWANDLFLALLLAFLIYVVLALIIAFFQAAAYKEVNNGRGMPRCKAVAKGLVFFPIVVLSFLPELPNLSHIRGLLMNLMTALALAIFLQFSFSLPEEYRQAAERRDRTSKIQGIIYLTAFFLTLVWFVSIISAWPVYPEDISPCAPS